MKMLFILIVTVNLILTQLMILFTSNNCVRELYHIFSGKILKNFRVALFQGGIQKLLGQNLGLF